ncbi:hypothetical protein HRED_00085 [Candidatus Haloredivivus sp. G17]|nr:hypothetical protein HRED_00085 [Candidatus Haloredivivus sp. G17]
MNDIRNDVVKAKDLNGRQFNNFTSNFYVIKSALRYYSVNQGLSFTASKIGDEFPVSVPAAGSSLKILSDLGVVESRNDSSSANRYMPDNVDLEKLLQVEDILIEQLELEEFNK